MRRDQPGRPNHLPAADASQPGTGALEATIARAPIGLAQFDENGKFLLVNDRLCELVGRSPEEMRGLTFQDISFPDDLPRCLEMNRRLATGEIPGYSLQKRFTRADGSLFWTRITVSVVWAADGSVDFFVGAAEDITEQVEASEALRAAEERLRTALGASRIGTFKFDLRTNELAWADGLDRVFGMSGRVRLEEFLEVIHPADRERVQAAVERSASDGSDFEEEFRAVWPDGTTHWLHDRGRTIPGDDGRPRYIVGAITDVTSKRRLEEELEERESEFRTLANAIPQMAWIARPDGTRTWYNDRWYEYTGLGPGDMEGLGWMQVHEPGLGRTVLEQQLTAFDEGTVWEQTVRLRGRDGSYRWFLSRAMPVRGPDGAITRWFGTNTDITDRQEIEQRYRQALDVDNIGVIFFDNEHRITHVNRAFAAMCGLSVETITGGMALWRDLTSVRGREFARARESEYDRTGRTTPSEQEFVRPDGTHWWGLVTANRLGPAEGVKYVLDVSGRIQAEREREEMLEREQAARTEAEHASALRQQVLGLVAHDLRNPLHAILSASGLLLMDRPLPEDKRTDQLALIQRCSRTMDRLIEDLLDVSRMEAGTFSVEHQRVDVHALLQEVATSFAERTGAARIDLSTEVEPACPPLEGDRHRLVQALSNLVGNAIKFTPPGGTVRLAARSDDASVELTVEDTGAGIPETDLPRIFEHFWQARRTAGGAGLGLAIVKGIVESHGGTVEVDSEPGRGTTFALRLPRPAEARP